VPIYARKKNNKMKTELIKGILYGVTITIVGVLVANQIQKAIDKARVSTPNA
jgi:hypothetical protein